MYVKRTLQKQLVKFAKYFPVIAILGPRQSGKTTLAQEAFKKHYYINLEDFNTRAAATQDPKYFLEGLLKKRGVIIDEFQKMPELLSYIQVIVDREKKPGFFVLTGSQNFLMNQAITQSLAGRVGILTLLPLSTQELRSAKILPRLSQVALFNGCYPQVCTQKKLDPGLIYPSYIQTYVERDVRDISNVSDLSTFKKFMGLCAGRVGQLLNLSSLATDCAISVPTAKAWLSILEASYVVFLLTPHHKNFSKRLIKNPKLYFYDTGVACSLLGIESEKDLGTHYLRGPLFENYVIADVLKQYYNLAKQPKVYFWRDSHGHEIDCVIEKADTLYPIEIKSGTTIHKDFFSGLAYWQELTGTHNATLVYAGKENFGTKTIAIKSWQDLNIFKLK